MKGPSREAYWASQLYTRSSAGPHPYVAGETRPDGSGGYWLDGDDHYDPILGFRKVQDYSVRKGLLVNGYAEQIAAALVRFRDRAVRATGGPPEGPGVSEYHRYLTGIAKHYLTTGDPADVEAADILNPTHDPATYPALYGHSGRYREAAFVLLTCLDREWMGFGPHPLSDTAAQVCLDQSSDVARPKERRRYGVYLKPFMGAINMMALIRYWEAYRKSAAFPAAILARMVPPTVKALCQYIWDECWYPPGENLQWSPGEWWDKGSVAYRDVASDDPRYVPIEHNPITKVIDPRAIVRGPETLSPVDGYYNKANFLVDGVADAFGVADYFGSTRQITLNSVYLPGFDLTTSHTFTLRPDDWKGPDQGEGNGPSPDLNHMVAPAFAWCYWHEKVIVGDAKAAGPWRDRYHAIFDGAIQSWSPAATQKVYNQSAYWTTDGLDWAERADAFGGKGDGKVEGASTLAPLLLIPSPGSGPMLVLAAGTRKGGA